MFPFSYSGQKHTDIIPTTASALVVVYIEISDRSSFICSKTRVAESNKTMDF